MSTLFDSYYDNLGHEMHIGDTVMGETCGYLIYGHIINILLDKNSEEKYVIIPDIGYKSNKTINLKKKYKKKKKKVSLIKITRKK